MTPTSKSMRRTWSRARHFALGLVNDRRGVAAIEFAMLVPIMLVMFFGTVEISSGVAVGRKVTLMARTLSDLTSQSLSVANTDLTNFFAASTAIMTPYAPATPTGQPLIVTELYVDPATLKARVQWSMGGTISSTGAVTLVAGSSISGHGVGTTMTIPTQLVVGGTYLIFSEVKYVYTPAVGYVMSKAGVTLSDVSYTRPRQSQCVIYPTPATGVAWPACPTS